MKRILALILVLTAALPLLSGCALFKGPISDGEIREILGEILPGAAELNRCIWSDYPIPSGVSEEDRKSTVSLYKTVEADFPYHDLDSFMADVQRYYTAEMSVIIAEYAFDNTDNSMARFCNLYDDNRKVIDLRVDVTENHPPFNLTASADISTARVKRSTGSIIDAEIETATANGKTNTLTINLLKEEGAWKINSYNWIAEVKG